MTKKKVPVSIGITAYNEASNIGNLLRSISMQKETTYKISEIVLISDGSTDDTVREIQSFKDRRIKLHIGKKRIGQASRLNEIFENAKEDILVLFDADVRLSLPNTVEELIKPFFKNKNIMLIGGNPQPYKGRTFTETAVGVTFRVYDRMRSAYKNGDNVYSCCGPCLAIRKKLTQTIRIPQQMFATDVYLYFSCLTKGYTFKRAPLAKVNYHLPSNLSDQIVQNKRFVASAEVLRYHFGTLVDREYTVPKMLMLKALSTECIKMPIHSLYIFFVNMYSKIQAKQVAQNMNAVWTIAATTKHD